MNKEGITVCGVFGGKIVELTKKYLKRMYIMYKIKYYLPIIGACALWIFICIGILIG